MAREYVAFGIKKIEPSIFKNIGVGDNLKPVGGLFAYQLTNSDDFISPYEKWCEEERIERGSLREGVKFTIDSRARIYDIDSWADLHLLIRKYPSIKTVQGLDTQKVIGIDIDFEKVSEKYDIISFSNKGISNTTLYEEHYVNVKSERLLKGVEKEYEVDGLINLNTSSWETPCLVIFNPQVIKNPRFFTNPNIHQLDKDELYDEITKELDLGNNEEQIQDKLNQYCEDDVEIQDVLEYVKTTQENDQKQDELIKRLEGLIKVQLKDNIDLKEDIDLTVYKMYEISAKEEPYDAFNKYVCSSLKNGIAAITSSQVKVQSVEDAMIDAFGDFFED